MQLLVRVRGVATVDQRLRVLPKALSRQILEDALGQAAEPLLADIRAGAPVRTGRLRDSIAIKKHRMQRQDQAHIELGVFGVFYGRFIEFGTSKMTARPFVRPALDRHSSALIRRFSLLVRGLVDDYVRANVNSVVRPRFRLGRQPNL
jgi:HK97 gp10 family phage protein